MLYYPDADRHSWKIMFKQSLAVFWLESKDKVITISTKKKFLIAERLQL